MAKKRTKLQKISAKNKRLDLDRTNQSDIRMASAKHSIAEIAFTGEKIYLVKNDLLKTVVITIAIAILLFGIYLYLG